MQVSEIIARGRWTPIKYKAYEFDDKMLILNTSGSDFTDESIRKYNEVQGINNKILLEVRDMLSKGESQILVFADSVESAMKFSLHTPNSAVVYAGTPQGEKEAILRDFQAGVIKVVYQMMILGVGYDHPSLKTIIFGRPTNSYRIYSQAVGRGVRLHPSKKDFTFIDYGGNVKRFGPVEDLTYEDHPINGWSMFSGERLISGTSMGGAPVYRTDLVPKKELPAIPKTGYVIGIGKFKGKRLDEVKRAYLEFMIYQSGFDYTRGTMKEFYDETKKFLESTKMMYVL